METKKLGTFSTLSIGLGGMIGGGIFAVTGLIISIAHGAAPYAFIIAGIVALLTAYSYWKLTLAYPNEGGTIEFINKGYSIGVLSGGFNILLCFNYIILIAIYAYAFAAYVVQLIPVAEPELWKHIILSLVLMILMLFNIFKPKAVIGLENYLNIGKLVLLALFIFIGFYLPMNHASNLLPGNFDVSTFAIISGAMIIFLNYEGFELIANAAEEIKDPKKSLPVAYIGGVIITAIIYALITIVVIGHLSLAEIQQHSDYVLSATAQNMFGQIGFVVIAFAAVLATSSAINATFYASSRLTYIIAKSGELPQQLEKSIKGQHLVGLFIFAFFSLIVGNFVPLDAIATIGSCGFLIIFAAVNWICFKKAEEVKASKLITFIAIIGSFSALLAVIIRVAENPKTQYQLWGIAVVLLASFLIEAFYRRYSQRMSLKNQGS